MKKIHVLIFLVVFSACDNKQSERKNIKINSEKKAVNATLDAWHKNASESKYDAYFNAMASSSIFIGTDASEYWNNKDFKTFSKPFFDLGKAWDFKPLTRNVYISADGKIAWFDELLDTWMGICRGSGVLSKTENTWKIEQYILSVTIPNTHITDVIAIKKEKDSLFLSRQKK
ncbi:MAG: nuclear transport factor 2 family protein [Lutibacter sp.]|nr:nuclear transport factor 2 family protein [Lutibacter sp.]